MRNGEILNETIKESTLKELMRSGSACRACVKGEIGGFSITFLYGCLSRTLSSSRGGMRKFASLNTAMEFLRQLGIERFEVDARLHEPGRIRKARPDRAEALRKTRTTPRQQELLTEPTE
jgi:hypothetical protein